MKPKGYECLLSRTEVAPLAVAWIETEQRGEIMAKKVVAPLAGAWIETRNSGRVRRSKSVAPLAGAWIETRGQAGLVSGISGRTPRGCVD